MKMIKKLAGKFGIGALLAAFSATALAFTVPTAGELGFEIYDMVVSNILQGAVGMTAAVVALVFGVSQLFRSWVMGVAGIVLGTLILQSENIVVALGMTL